MRQEGEMQLGKQGRGVSRLGNLSSSVKLGNWGDNDQEFVLRAPSPAREVVGPPLSHSSEFVVSQESTSVVL